jgi:hypothetical protein
MYAYQLSGLKKRPYLTVISKIPGLEIVIMREDSVAWISGAIIFSCHAGKPLRTKNVMEKNVRSIITTVVVLLLCFSNPYRHESKQQNLPKKNYEYFKGF